MISIRKERPPDVVAREALLDEAFGTVRWREKLAAPAGRPHASRRSRLRGGGGQARYWHGPTLGYCVRQRRAGFAPGAGRRRGRPPQPRHRRSAGTSRDCCGEPAWPPGDRPGRRRALLRPFWLLGREGCSLAHAWPLRAPSPARPRTRTRRTRRRSRAIRAPAGARFRGPTSPPPPHNSGRMSWTPGGFRPASIPFALRRGYDQPSWRR